MNPEVEVEEVPLPFIERTRTYCPVIKEAIRQMYAPYPLSPDNTKTIATRYIEYFTGGYTVNKLVL